VIDWNGLVAPKLVVYGLIDPRSRLIRYVGMSTKGLSRAAAHRTASELRKATPHKNNWIAGLLAAGLDYEVVTLDRASSKEELEATERFWIAFGHACGWPLTNLTPGGEGRPWPRGVSLSPEHLAKLRGRKQSPEHVAKRAAARRGSKLSSATRAKIATTLRGRKLSPEHKARVSASLVGNKRAAVPRTAAFKARVSEVHKGRKRSVETCRKISEAKRRRA